MKTKQYVLQMLEQSRGKSISGQQLAEQLDISRSAVWKAIQELKKDGYSIEAVTNRGYSLAPESDILSPEGISLYLTGADSWRLHYFGEVDSTNAAAQKLALEGAADGTVVIAENQTAGRGRLGRSFYSMRGSGIYLSYILRPKMDMQRRNIAITAAAAVAVCRAILEVTGKECQIKWVNDIYWRGKKVCGILTEAQTDMESGTITQVIIGIGLNYNIRVQQFPAGLRKTAGSLCLAREHGVSKNKLAAAIVTHLDVLRDNPSDNSYMEEYARRSLLPGKRIVVTQGDTRYTALADRVDADGMLAIVMPDGERRTLRSADVTIEIKG